ncbi:MAG: type I methionyl aminopeptidase [Clostridia bacterium]
MRISGKILSETLNLLECKIQPNISTLELDKIAEKYIIDKGAVPSFLNYNGFPASICTSLNEIVVHGIPNNNVVLKCGDIISVDVGVCYKGMHTDAARTFPVGMISEEKQKLINLTKQSFYEGIKHLKVGGRLGEVSNAIQRFAESNGLGVVRELVGHGVGQKLHEDPQIPNYGKANSGEHVVENATLAIEPMLNLGTKNIYQCADGWGIITADGKPSSHHENTVLITKNGVEVLTDG